MLEEDKIHELALHLAFELCYDFTEVSTSVYFGNI